MRYKTAADIDIEQFTNDLLTLAAEIEDGYVPVTAIDISQSAADDDVMETTFEITVLQREGSVAEAYTLPTA